MKKRNSYIESWLKNSERNGSFEEPWSRLENIIKMDLKEIVLESEGS
jgi:hypothetical protein